MSFGIIAEKLFASLCSNNFLRGFVFHSPRYFGPTEREVGDIVLWVRLHVVIFEIVAKEPTVSSSTRQFVKRIGEKRDQLIRDFDAFKDPAIEILFTNQLHEKVVFDKKDLLAVKLSGVVIVDCDDHLESLHFGTIQKSLVAPFPIAVMTRKDFLELVLEVDTIPDLSYYLHDRFDFVTRLYSNKPNIFLDLNKRLEQNLIAFYKMNENQFPVACWEPENALNYYSIFMTEYQNQIIKRNEENKHSFIIDKIIDLLRNNHEPNNSTILHASELATMTRRQRASSISVKIRDAIERLQAGNSRRHFAFFNQETGCWMVFYFQYGGTEESFQSEVEKLTKYKLIVEIRDRTFQYSIFGYGFQTVPKSQSTFDRIFLSIEDAENQEGITDMEYKNACRYFGRNHTERITEFPG
jgi:hypothetical protein